MNNSAFHVIKDPVHGAMQFTTTEDNWVKPFIDSANFQRLRHIKQLGMGDYIFPGAVHTRFNHCLGCCYVASQIANKVGLAEEERQLVMIACLLHDIGHGPFSHAFEDIFINKIIRHEDWTPFFLAEYRTPEFFAAYNNHNPRHSFSEEKFQQVQNMIMHKMPVKQVVADIVSSQLDADRLDYLLRDSHFCGVTYGEFDFRWMLHCLAIVDGPAGERLGITYKGVGVVEHYLMARRLMMRNIYHSQKKLALEYLLIQLLINLSDSLDKFPMFAEIKKTRLGMFLQQVDIFNQKVKTFGNTPTMKQEFLTANYATYKELCDYDIFFVIKSLAQMTNDHAAVQLAQRINKRVIPTIFSLELNDVASVEAELLEFKQQHKHHFQDWQVALIKTPYKSYTGDEDPIYVVNNQGAIKPISAMSLMINALSDQYESTAFLCVDETIAKDPIIQTFIDKCMRGIAYGVA